MPSWLPPSLKKRRLKSNNYRSCSSSKDSEGEVVVCEDDMLVRLTVLVSSFSFHKVLKVKVIKLIISRINKKAPMNIIICLPQGNFHRTTKSNINSSVLYRLSNVSDLSSLTSSISMKGRSKLGVRKPGVEIDQRYR